MKVLNKRGAASIIVIFMIMVLFVFGMLALTTAVANLRLSKKSSEWVKDFYELEITAEELMFEFDTRLESAELKARDVIEKRRNMADGFVSYGDEFERQYFLAVCDEIAGFANEYIEEAVFDKASYEDRQIPLGDIEPPLIYFDIGREGTKKHLYVGVQVVFPEYDIDGSRPELIAKRLNPSQRRFSIIEWREWQEPFKYDEPIQFWSGEMT